MSFRRRTYPEVLNNLITTLTGGVAAESYPFPPPGAKDPPYRYPLQQPPVTEIVAVYGSQNGQPHEFRKGKDYRLKDPRTLEWLQEKDSQLPDAGTLIDVNYQPGAARDTLTDIYTGSVVRTLAETMALEIARLYATLDTVYQAAYIDTATGSALDHVVALLGITRVTGGRAAGGLEFTRQPGSHGAITILAGTRVITADGEVEYTTTETVTMADEQSTIRVNARDTELNDSLPTGALTILPIPIMGIAGVTNPSPTLMAAQDETDEELRARAKSLLHGSERATRGALEQAIARQQITATIEEVEEDGIRLVRVTPHADMTVELEQRLLTAIAEVRPVGVLVDLVTTGKPPAKVNLALRLVSSPDLLEQDLRAAQDRVRAKVSDYFSRLETGKNASLNRIIGLVLSVPEITDVTLESASWAADGAAVETINGGELDFKKLPVTLGELQLVDPNLPTHLSVTVTFPKGTAPADKVAIQAALSTTTGYLNRSNTSPTAGRDLAYALLLLTVPLPGKVTQALQAYDEAAAKPALPDAAALGAYKLKFIFSQQTGLSQMLANFSDLYPLAALERLAVQTVEVAEEG